VDELIAKGNLIQQDCLALEDQILKIVDEKIGI
jgi:hypothetical protein